MENQEGIVYGEIDFDKIILAKHFVDCVGHYSRPDVFTLLFNNRRLTPVERVSQFNHVFKSGLNQEVEQAIEVLKKNLHKVQDDEMVAAIEDLARLI